MPWWDLLVMDALHCRYNPNNGKLTLVSEKYEMREDNRRHIMEMITGLVSEGRQAFPAEDAELPPEGSSASVQVA